MERVQQIIEGIGYEGKREKCKRKTMSIILLDKNHGVHKCYLLTGHSWMEKNQWTLKHKFALSIQAKLHQEKFCSSWPLCPRQHGALRIERNCRRKHAIRGKRAESSRAKPWSQFQESWRGTAGEISGLAVVAAAKAAYGFLGMGEAPVEAHWVSGLVRIYRQAAHQ